MKLFAVAGCILFKTIPMLWLALTASTLASQESSPPGQESINQQQSTAATPQVTFSVNLNQLASNNAADESFWLEVLGQKSLVLKYRPKGRIPRGNVVLFHAQGEHAGDSRVTGPLATQMSHLGWQVLVPNLPIEDFPSTDSTETVENDENPSQSSAQGSAQSTSETDPDTNQSKPAKENSDSTSQQKDGNPERYFNDKSAYQNFIAELIKELKPTIEPKNDPLVFIAIQNSAFWILEPLKTNEDVTQLVLIEPQVPANVERNLEIAFTGQKLPVFTFIQSNDPNGDFVEAFERRWWLSSPQRMNRGVYSQQGIQSEDFQVAKLITGWVKVQLENK
jgi:hypothetical protein